MSLTKLSEIRRDINLPTYFQFRDQLSDGADQSVASGWVGLIHPVVQITITLSEVSHVKLTHAIDWYDDSGAAAWHRLQSCGCTIVGGVAGTYAGLFSIAPSYGTVTELIYPSTGNAGVIKNVPAGAVTLGIHLVSPNANVKCDAADLFVETCRA